jgi:hypothetical protein
MPANLAWRSANTVIPSETPVRVGLEDSAMKASQFWCLGGGLSN